MGLFDWNGNGRYDMFDAFVTRSFFKSVERAERKARRRVLIYAKISSMWNDKTKGQVIMSDPKITCP